MVDLASIVTGGATRPDSLTGLQPDFLAGLQALLDAAPPDIKAQLQISSGYRSPERQAQLYQDALAKYGSPEVARKWVAPPGRSQHNMGFAADLKFGSPAAIDWAHQNAGRFGLAFPLPNENWHIELAGARAGHRPAPVAAAGAPAAPQAPAAAFAPPMAPGGVPVPPQAPLGTLALLFMQGQQDRQRQREEEQAAEDARRAALFADPGIFA